MRNPTLESLRVSVVNLKDKGTYKNFQVGQATHAFGAVYRIRLNDFGILYFLMESGQGKYTNCKTYNKSIKVKMIDNLFFVERRVGVFYV